MGELITAPIGIELEIKSVDKLLEFSRILAKTEMVPKAYRGKADDIFVGILFGQELGLSPLQSLQNVANINGRPSIWGDAAKALCENSGQLEAFREWFELDGKELDETEAFEAFILTKNVVAKCYVKRKSKKDGVTKAFSARMAQHAGLLDKGTVWDAYPISMLSARPRGFALRSEFPDVMKGLHLREEMMGTPIDMEETSRGSFEMSKHLEQAEAAEVLTLVSGPATSTPQESPLVKKLQMPKPAPGSPKSAPLAAKKAQVLADPQAPLDVTPHKQEEPEPETKEDASVWDLEELRGMIRANVKEIEGFPLGLATMKAIYADCKIVDTKSFSDDPKVLGTLLDRTLEALDRKRAEK